MNLGERLRGVVAPASRVGLDVRPKPSHDAPTPRHDIAETLGGSWCDEHGHPFLVVERRYSCGHRHGRVAVADALPPADGVWPRLPMLATPVSRRGSEPWTGRVLFLDLETTGLAGGAGTYAFLVGLAWFDGPNFRIRQFFLSSFVAERAILAGVAELARSAAAVVTFNGKSFDIPLVDTRYALHRVESPFDGRPHVDMLHIGRRFWREDGASDDDASADAARGRGCRLADLERSVCGHEREGDVPGFEIPARYFDYVRSGDARPLEPVLEHNRMDLLSLALLTARVSQLLGEGHDAAATPREGLALGGIYERAGLAREARDAYAWASGLSSGEREDSRARRSMRVDPATRAEALRAYAMLARRERRFADAAQAWEKVLELGRCPPPIAREATEALAVHHEHRTRDLAGARQFAVQSLQYRSTSARTHAAHHRLARLDRKLGRPPDAVGLF